MGTIFANLIHAGMKRFKGVPKLFEKKTEQAFLERYGITIQEWESTYASD